MTLPYIGPVINGAINYNFTEMQLFNPLGRSPDSALYIFIAFPLP